MMVNSKERQHQGNFKKIEIVFLFIIYYAEYIYYGQLEIAELSKLILTCCDDYWEHFLAREHSKIKQ